METGTIKWKTAGVFFSKYGIYFAFVLLAGVMASV
jgi:hypothetical protein